MGGKGTTSQSFKPPKAFMNAYKDSLKMARHATDDPYRAYRGDLVAGLTPTQRRGIRNVNEAQGMALPAIQQGMKYTRQAAKGVTPGLYKQYYSPYVKDVAKTTMANLMESQGQQQSALKAGAIQGGAFGGDRSGVALAEMARQQQLGNAMAMSNIYNQGYGQAMDLAGRQVANLGAMGQQMAGLGAAAQGSVLQGAQAQMAAGAQQQATKQAELQAAYEQWMQKRAYPYQNAQFFANIAQGLGAGAGGTSSTTPPAPNLFSQILGGVGAIGNIAAAAPSDKRIKENIEAVGTLNDGQTIYRYNFKGDPKTQIGLLAQEVEHTKPGAVTQAKGIKMVNYKTATDDAAEMSHAGGSVFQSGDRQGLAAGGIPFFPYADAQAYVPEGKIGGNAANIPKAPEPYEDKGLAEDWKNFNPIDEKSAAGLRGLAAKVGLDFPSTKTASAPDTVSGTSGLYNQYSSDDQYGGVFSSGGLVGFSNGGTAARTNYADGGGSLMDKAIDEASGLGAGPTPESSSEFNYPSNEEVESYIAQSAVERGMDPDVAIKVWRSEGASGDPREAWQSKVINKKGQRERSYGPYQLYMEGGLGNEMLKATGLSPEDPRNWKPSVDFALDQAATGGWGPWYGAKAIGLDSRAGLANAKPLGKYSAAGTGIVPAADVPDPDAPVESGYVIEGEKPGLKFDMKKLFASEDNPSIIESIMGRRLSPEARSAVLNASFALMAGRSPYFLTNVGEAGKVGTQTYYNALAQKAGLAEKQAEVQKKLAETSAVKQTLRQKLLSLYYMSKSTFDQDPSNDGKVFMPFDEWAAKNGFPDIGSSQPSVVPMQPVAPPPLSGGDAGTALPSAPAEGATEGATDATEKPYTVQPEGSPTVLASAEGGPSPANKNTLPYWQDRIRRLQNARSTADYISPEYAASIDKQIELARGFSNDILNSDDYKRYASFTANYEKTRSDLEKLAKINARFKGGRGSEQWANFIGALQTAGLDWAIPENWQSVPGDYDQVMKAATEMAVRNAASVGGLSKAPGSLMELESKFTPDANLSPSARYSIIKSALADLAYNNDVYATWDMGPNFAQHQNEFNRKNKYSNYVKFAEETLPGPALYEGEIAPITSGENPPEAKVNPEIVNEAIVQLNEKFSDAENGSVKYSKIDGKQFEFVKTPDGWVAVQ